MAPRREETVHVGTDLLHVDLVDVGVDVLAHLRDVLLGVEPQATLSATVSGGTSDMSAAKSLGRGRIWEVWPGNPSLAHNRCAVLSAASASRSQQTLVPACTGLSPPPASRNCLTRSPSGMAMLYPSPMRAATSTAWGPNADT